MTIDISIKAQGIRGYGRLIFEDGEDRMVRVRIGGVDEKEKSYRLISIILANLFFPQKKEETWGGWRKYQIMENSHDVPVLDG